MSVNIKLYRYNWDRLILDLQGLGITDAELLEDILLKFGEKCGNRYYLLNNEYYEDYNSYYNAIYFIQSCFNIKGDSIVHSVFLKNRKEIESASRSEFDVQAELKLDFEFEY